MGCFHIASNLFVTRPWHFFVEVKIVEMKTIPIWAIIKRLPIELWDDDGFSAIGSAIGCPLFVDRLTEEATRTSYARICIKIDPDCEYPESIPVVLDERKTYLLPVEYNWKPPKCKKCCVVGHTTEGCSKINKTTSRQQALWLRKEAESEKSKEHGETSEHKKEGTSDKDWAEIINIQDDGKQQECTVKESEQLIECGQKFEQGN